MLLLLLNNQAEQRSLSASLANSEVGALNLRRTGSLV